MDGEISFRCLAQGYPNLHFLTWQTATGINITNSGTNSSEQSFYESTMWNTLSGIDSMTCLQAGGYRCVYDNGNSSTSVSSSSLECPKG